MSGKRLIVGYKNGQLIYELSKQGKFLQPYGSKMTLDSMQMCLLQFMALTTYDFPPTKEIKERHLPCRLYERGWEYAARQFGMWLPGGEEVQEIFKEGGMQRLSEKNMKSAIRRLSVTAKKLEEAGLVKCLRKADIQRNIPAKWLLMLGDDRENLAAEKWALDCILRNSWDADKPWKRKIV